MKMVSLSAVSFGHPYPPRGTIVTQFWKITNQLFSHCAAWWSRPIKNSNYHIRYRNRAPPLPHRILAQ